MKNSIIDLSNADGLDESIFFNSSNFTNESLLDGLTENTSLLNADGDSPAPKKSGGGAGQYVNAETVQAGVAATTAIASSIMANKNSPAGQSKKEIKAVCGTKMPFYLNKKKKKAYQECVANYLKSKQPVAPVYNPSADRSINLPPVVDNKILGMPKPLFVGLSIVATVALIFVGVKIYKANAVKA